MANLASLKDSGFFTELQLLKVEQFSSMVTADPTKLESLSDLELAALYDLYIGVQESAEALWRAPSAIMKRNLGRGVEALQHRKVERARTRELQQKFSAKAVEAGDTPGTTGGDDIVQGVMAALGLGAVAATAVVLHPNPYVYKGKDVLGNGLSGLARFSNENVVRAFHRELPENTRVYNSRTNGTQLTFEIQKYFEGTGWVKVVQVAMIETGNEIEVTLTETEAEAKIASVKEGGTGALGVLQDLLDKKGSLDGFGDLLSKGRGLFEGGADLLSNAVNSIVKPFKGFKFEFEVWKIFDAVMAPYVAAYSAYVAAELVQRQKEEEQRLLELSHTQCSYCGNVYVGAEESCGACNAQATPESVEHRKKLQPVLETA